MRKYLILLLFSVLLTTHVRAAVNGIMYDPATRLIVQSNIVIKGLQATNMVVVPGLSGASNALSVLGTNGVIGAYFDKDANLSVTGTIKLATTNVQTTLSSLQSQISAFVGAPSGTVVAGSLTSGTIPQASSSTNLVNSPVTVQSTTNITAPNIIASTNLTAVHVIASTDATLAGTNLQTTLSSLQSQISADVSGTGTANTIAKWTSTTGQGSSKLTDDGTTITATSGANWLLSGGTATLQSTNVASLFNIKSETPTDLPILIDVYSSTVVPGIAGRRARGTIATPTAVQTDDVLAQLGGRGYGATAFSSTSRSRVRAVAGQAWTDSAQGSYLSFDATPNGGTTTAEYARLTDTSGFTATALSLGATPSAPDVYFVRDGANQPAFRNGTTAQNIKVYNTYTDGSNYERFGIGWSGNQITLETEAAGSGSTSRGLNIGTVGAGTFSLFTGNANKLVIGSSNGAGINPGSDAAIPFGSAALRWNGVTSTIYTANAGSISSDTPNVFSQQWNSGGVTFHGFQVVVTNTAAAAASEALQIQVGSSPTEVAAVKTDGSYQITGTGGSTIGWADGVGLIHANAINGQLTLATKAGSQVLIDGFGSSAITILTSKTINLGNSTAISQNGVGILAVGTGTFGNASGTVQASRYISGVDAAGVKGSTWSLDTTLGDLHTATSTASTAMTITPSSAGTAGQVIRIVITSDVTGGDVITFASTFLTTGTATLTASKKHSFSFVSDGTNWCETGRALNLN